MTRRIQAVAMAALLTLLLVPAANARSVGDFHGFSQAELDQLLAPVALYPDTVLSHVLIAATYPLEVVQAARWTRAHPDLRGEVAVEAVIDHPWDPSVMALVAFPDLLARMDSDLDWTQRLGDAFLVQEEDVLDSIQRLRGQAHRSGHLGSNEHVQVVREREVIYIEPARRQVIYLPYYNPRVVYGRWHWADYPPVAWYHPRRHRSGLAFYWSPAYHVAPTFFFSSFHWSRRQVVVVNHYHHYYRPSHYPRPHTVVHQRFYSGRDLARHDAARRWTHKPTHRRGVAYRSDVPDRHRQQVTQSSRQRALARSEQAGPSPRNAQTRSQQRQWAAARRSEPIRKTGSTARSRPGSVASRSERPENRRDSTRSVTRRAPSRSRSVIPSSDRATRHAEPARNSSIRSTRGRSSASSDRGAAVERRLSERPSSRSSTTVSTARRMPSAAARPAGSSRVAAPTSSAGRVSSPSPAMSAPRSRSSSMRTTRPARSAAPPAAARERAASRQVTPTPPRRSSDRARTSLDRSASGSTSRASRSQQPSRLSERAAARRRD